jgi:hypothetical protein
MIYTRSIDQPATPNHRRIITFGLGVHTSNYHHNCSAICLEFHNNVIGLLKATYLGPPIVIPTSFTEGEGIKNESEGGQETLGVTFLVLVAVGSAALIVFVGSVYYMRRDSHSEFSAVDVEGNATRAAGSSFQDDNTFPFIVSPRIPSPRPTSPFSEMLPNAYQFNENMSILSGGMSIFSGGDEGLEAVLERSDEEAQSPAHTDTDTDTSSIMVSDAGYTTDAGKTTRQILVFRSTYQNRCIQKPQSRPTVFCWASADAERVL